METTETNHNDWTRAIKNWQVLDWDNKITGKCLYWELAQIYGQSAHQLGRDALVQAVVPAEVLHPDEDPPDTRGSSARLVSTGTAVCAGHRRASVSRAFTQPRLDCAWNVVFQQYTGASAGFFQGGGQIFFIGGLSRFIGFRVHQNCIIIMALWP